MVSRLSEILERIRPTGAPGPPTEGGQARERREEDREVADITAVLDEFEAEADIIVGAARDEAERIRREAEDQTRRARAGLADRVAASGAAAGGSQLRRTEGDLTRISAQAAHEVDRLHDQASTRIPELVVTAIDSIWSELELGPPPEQHP